MNENTTSFIAKIQLKGSVKVFFILLIISIVFFTFWFMIKPEIGGKTFGVITAPKDGILIPVDNSQCGKDIIKCENTNDCVSKCHGVDKDTSNYHCYQVPKDKEIYYLGTRLNEGDKYCLPTDDANNGEDSVISSCGTYTGRLIRTLNSKENGKATLGWFCQCKYPTYFSGDKCLDQVACKYEYIDQKDGSIQRSMGELIEFGEDDKPIILGATGQQYNVLTPDKITSDKLPVSVLKNGKPIWRCNCRDKLKTRGAISLPGDYLSCYPDLCDAGRGSSASQFDMDKMECVCGPQTYKSNIDGFCYPLEVSADANSIENSFSNICKPTKDNICTCGIKFVKEFSSDTTGSIKKFVGFLFRYDNDFYLSTVVNNDGKIVDDVSQTGETVFIKIDRDFINNLLIESFNTNETINTYFLDNQPEIEQKIDGWVLNVFKRGSGFNGLLEYLNEKQIGYTFPVQNLKNSFLETYYQSVRKIDYSILSNDEKEKIKNHLKDTLTVGTYTQESIINHLNDADFSNGKVPMRCNSFYSRQGEEFKRCDEYIGKDVVGNDMFNPLGVACVNFCGLNDPCSITASIAKTSCKLNPFNNTGYNCECPEISNFFKITDSQTGKDFCIKQLKECEPCRDDSQCEPNGDGKRNCTTCPDMTNFAWGDSCMKRRVDVARCTPTNDISRCSKKGDSDDLPPWWNY